MKQPIGDVIYDYESYRRKIHICRWWQYPFYRLLIKIKLAKYKFYRYLNNIGIMKTPEGCVMRVSDIWKR